MARFAPATSPDHATPAAGHLLEDLPHAEIRGLIATVDLGGRLLGLRAASTSAAAGESFYDLIHPDDVAQTRRLLEELAVRVGTTARLDFRIATTTGGWRWLHGEARRMPLDAATDVLLVESFDVTEKKRAEFALASQNRILERVIAGDPLLEILDAICAFVEALDEQCLCSILLSNPESNLLNHAASRGLSAEFIHFTRTLRIDEGVGSCGTAAFRKETVIVADIANDPLWDVGREEALRDGLRACWSTPIRDHGSGRILGTFAIYHRQPRVPTPAEITMVEQTGRLAGMAIKHDEMRQAQRRSEARFRAFVQHAADITALITPNGTIMYVSPAVIDLFGTTPRRLVGKKLREYVFPEDLPAAEAYLAGLADGNVAGIPRLEFRVADIVGEVHWLEAIVSDLSNDPNVGGIVVSARDISQRKVAEHHLKYLAVTDSLTGLPNRFHFTQQLSESLALRVNHESGPAVIFLDLDYFKRVNDEHGHAIGDRLLVAVGERLLGTLEPGDLLSRWGGDEFTILLEDEQRALAVASQVQRAFAQPFDLGICRPTITPSLGVAVGTPTSDAGHLIHQADMALYRAKATGRGRTAIYDPGLDQWTRPPHPVFHAPSPE